MKLVNTGEGLRQYWSQCNEDYSATSRYEDLHRLSSKKTFDELLFGDNVLMEYGDDDIFFILKIEYKTETSISGRVIESNTTDFVVGQSYCLDCDDDDLYTVIDDSNI